MVLIHGGGGTWRQWRPVVPLLTPRHEVLAVNLVGHWGGAPHPEGEEMTIDVLADGVERDMDEAGWPTAHIVGTSLGGMVALVLAARGQARTCTAMATMGGWDEGGDLGLKLLARTYRFFHWTTRLVAQNPEPWVRRPRLRRLLYWHHFARTDRMEPGDTALMLIGMANCTALAPLFDWAATHDGPSGFEAIECPVQILFAEKDHVLPQRRYGKRLVDAIPGAEVHVMPGVGHVATWDDPDLVARYLLEFIGRQAGSPAS